MDRSKLTMTLFVVPCLLSFAMIIIVPFFIGLYYSMTDWNGVNNHVNFVGLKNFVGLFRSASFLYSFLITIAFAVINVILVNVISFALALLVTSKVKFRNFYRAGFFVPYLIGGIVLGYIWQFIFNQAFLAVGDLYAIPFLQKSFLSEPSSVIWAMSFVNTWQYSGYIMLIYIASIQSVPASLLEAASVDGAGYFRRIWQVLIPMMANAFTISLFLTLTYSFKQFDMNYTLTNGGPATRFLGAPIKASQLLAMEIFHTARANRMAEAQAQAVIFFLILVIVSVIQVKVNKSREVEM